MATEMDVPERCCCWSVRRTPGFRLTQPACFRHLSGLVHGRIMLGGKTMLLDLQAVRRQKVYTKGI